jgi:hypothetical protein
MKMRHGKGVIPSAAIASAGGYERRSSQEAGGSLPPSQYWTLGRRTARSNSEKFLQFIY